MYVRVRSSERRQFFMTIFLGGSANTVSENKTEI